MKAFFNISNILLCLWIGFGATSCETIIDYELPETDPKLVVNAVFSPDSVWKVNVSKSRPLFDTNRIQPIVNASVMVEGPSGGPISLIHQRDGFYTSPSGIKPTGAGLYTIKASLNGYDDVEGITIVPPPVPILSVDTQTIYSFGYPLLRSTLTFNDPGGFSNYYSIKVFFNSTTLFYQDSGMYDTLVQSYELYIFEEEELNQGFSPGANTQENDFFTDELFDGNSYITSFTSDYPYLFSFGKDTIIEAELTYQLRSISPDYYQYFRSLREQQATNFDPFAQPVQVFGNIENGFGIFAGYSVATVKFSLL